MKLQFVAALGTLILLVVLPFSFAKVVAKPAVDSYTALNNPDKFAWDLFTQLNWPALPGTRGVPDPTRKPGDAGQRLWESWKITTPFGSEVFLEKGQRPEPWDNPQKLAVDGQPRKFLSPPKFTFVRFDLLGIDPHERFREMERLGLQLFQGEESRMNRPGFEFIVSQGLYSVDGQEAFRATGRAVEFPSDTVAVKAAWRRFSEAEIKNGVPLRFYTHRDPDGTYWGLTGFHISSKVIPNWFWATFEQVDNPPPEIPDRDRYAKFRYPNATSAPENRLREVPDDLQNTVWQYYVLRGTQVDFTDSMGNPIILGNTQLENGMQTTASCMGCHARATIGDRVDDIVINGRRLYPAGTFFYPVGRVSKDGSFVPGHVGVDGSNRLTVDTFELFWQQDPQKPDPNTAIALTGSAHGAPDPDSFVAAGTGKLRYTQLGFMWEFMFAERK